MTASASNPNRHASADSDGHPYTNAGSNFDSHRHADACSDSHVDTHPDGRHADVLAKRLPAATLRVVAGANHLLPATHHKMLGAFLLEQLRD